MDKTSTTNIRSLSTGGAVFVSDSGVVLFVPPEPPPRRLVVMGWLERARKASAGQRVSRSDRQHAMATVDELNALNAERARLMRDGLVGVATITEIRQNVATTMLGNWHELVLEVRLPNRDVYRATRRVALELSASSHIRIGSEVPVRVDPQDPSRVLVVAGP